MLNVDSVKVFLRSLQENLVKSLQAYEPQQQFLIDCWERTQTDAKQVSGYGDTRVLRHGEVFESAGVNFSHIYGDNLPQAASNQHALGGRKFEAMGISSVIHPQNPYVPTSHLNVRFFIAGKDDPSPIWWFGGGFDLTPYYPYEEDVLHWHQTARQACQPFGQDIYPHYKNWADTYFYLPHRKETRGVGGLFFDDLNTKTWGWDFERCFAFLRSVGSSFWLAYEPIVKQRYQHPFAKEARDFQLYRRGRYVEFNLCFDRGTLFGLQSGGRTESILMSLPPRVSWEYQWEPKAGTPEANLYERYLKPQDWLKLGDGDKNSF